MSRCAHHRLRVTRELCGDTADVPVRSHQLEVSVHAIDRYVDRVDATADAAQAEAEIRAAMDGAKRLHRQGADRWFYQASGDRRYQLVVREAPGKPRAVMTVLTVQADAPPDDSEAWEP